MDETLKKKRAAAKGLFTRAQNRFLQAVDSYSDAAIVKERFSNVKERWNQLQLKHEMHKNLLEETKLVGADTDEIEREAIRNQEEQWICRVEEKFEDAECVHADYIRKATTQPITANFDQSLKEKQSTLLKRKVEERAFRKHAADLEQPIKDESCRDTPMYNVIRDAQSEMKNIFQSCKKSNSKYVTTLTELKIEDEMEWLSDLQKLMADINLQVGKMEQYKHESKSKGLCLERMQMPQFNGDMRDYPRFKSYFQKQVQPTVGGEQEAAYALNTAFEIIRNVDDDLKEIWERLTKKQGKPSKLIDVVVNDIRRLTIVHEGEEQKLLHLIDTVERRYRDLFHMKLDKEMLNNTVVSMIEEKLPRDIG